MTDLTAPRGPAPLSRAAARLWLADHFAEHGPEIPCSDVMAAAIAAGHSRSTLKRAWSQLVAGGVAESFRATGALPVTVTVWSYRPRVATAAPSPAPVADLGLVDQPYRPSGTPRWDV